MQRLLRGPAQLRHLARLGHYGPTVAGHRQWPCLGLTFPRLRLLLPLQLREALLKFGLREGRRDVGRAKAIHLGEGLERHEVLLLLCRRVLLLLPMLLRLAPSLLPPLAPQVLFIVCHGLGSSRCIRGRLPLHRLLSLGRKLGQKARVDPLLRCRAAPARAAPVPPFARLAAPATARPCRVPLLKRLPLLIPGHVLLLLCSQAGVVILGCLHDSFSRRSRTRHGAHRSSRRWHVDH
mmetsp:Transcript_27585/g.64352  ORF Transcript_27585/g.64352 Transcript_27585/m.64352 type:complete len:236 (-) Transcript_27585:207-914(-)